MAWAEYGKIKLDNIANPNNVSNAIPFLSISYIMAQKSVFIKVNYINSWLVER